VDAAYVAVAWVSFLPFALSAYAAGRWARAGWAAGDGARASLARALGEDLLHGSTVVEILLGRGDAIK